LPQPRERRSQIVRNIIRNLPHLPHERRDPVKHCIKATAEFVELAAATRERDPPPQVTLHDLARGPIDRFDAAEDSACEEKGARKGEPNCCSNAQQESADKYAPDRVHVRSITPHRKVGAASDLFPTGTHERARVSAIMRI